MTKFVAKYTMKCKHCKAQISSQYPGHYAVHDCAVKPTKSKMLFAVDETTYSCRHIGNPEDYEVLLSHEDASATAY